MKISSDEGGLGEDMFQISFPPAIAQRLFASLEQFAAWPFRPLVPDEEVQEKEGFIEGTVFLKIHSTEV